jgi:2,3-dihydroxybenzoate decarboxylase
MRRIALEEHYTTAALADSFRSFAIGFNKETVAPLVADLSDFDGQRLETMDQAGIDISVSSVAGAGVQNERSAATAVPHAGSRR